MFRSVNPEQVAAILRTVVQVLGGVLGTLGVVNDETWMTISGPLLTGLTLLWGVWARSDKNLLLSAAQVPATAAVVVPTAIMASSASLTAEPKVVTPG